MKKFNTGFKKLDKYLEIEKGDLFVVGSRPAIGKTAFLINLLINLSNNNFKCKFFSLELYEKDLKNRILKALRNDKEKANKIFSNIIIDDESPIADSNERIKNKIDKNVQVVLIDYLQVLTVDHKNTKENLKALKKIAREKDVVIIVATQISRVFERYRLPLKLSPDWLINKKKLWGNFAIDEIDEFIFIDRPGMRTCDEKVLANETLYNIADFVIVKNKNQMLASIECSWDRERYAFYEI